ncbi:pyridoxamine 5'-phosphate oxidase family protein [Tuwongella immobilis]|uniref:Pyridoxamine 5'-phosphate oxidase Alr4036 family FMN-binding domain-containing protein n=1 Tax=Tuwongella immobilis TaxID=692036 RepID=A0A6C2YTV9_9BACT|nr:pyridoxamine 5'-phosphate oxidase family protein [Tuwongella immobilis]VIP04864.1 pyridoxamine 5 -phosphate oxidase : Pyridoxamine 5'-phosphate oxidase-related FMN-binding OS=Methylobacterium sp. (strain 4-46) GN=M446_5868 PE=4 SV=1: Pyridox_oxidase [Tuwongella immobilis]VTS07087.1 pyridoxamine 5 -phosphate oxidase : Pyridoxamine 5'-phosphate oxidase-related FMN-binding OS=Methylobacterium sp. (strain 4-46) GN=M446_5868 PE=4 SV=1: Pyridox_oxidase [Tuwongella immobilis]
MSETKFENSVREAHPEEPAPLDYHNPTEAYAALSTVMARGVASAKHGFHLMTVCSLTLDGAPDARTVVLRRFDSVNREFVFHTDWRSPKVAQLQRDARVLLSLYDPRHRWQLRVPAVATLHHEDAVSLAAWKRSQPYSRSCYAIPHPPGEPTPLDELWQPPLTIEEDNAAVYANFAVVVCQFQQLEVLELRASGHRRARFDWSADGLAITRLSP